MNTVQLDSSARSHLGFLAPETRKMLDELRRHEKEIFAQFDAYLDCGKSISEADAAIGVLGTPHHRDTSALDRLTTLKSQRDHAARSQYLAGDTVRNMVGATWPLLERAGALVEKLLLVVVDSRKATIASDLATHFPLAADAMAVAEKTPEIETAMARVKGFMTISTVTSGRFGNEPAGVSHAKIKAALSRIDEVLAEAERAEPDLTPFIQ